MNADEISNQVFKLAFKAAMSQEYFQIMEWRWSMVDIAAKFAIAILAILGVYSARGTSGETKGGWLERNGFNVAVWSVFALLIILIIPTDKWTQDYRDCEQQWAIVRHELESLDDVVEKHGLVEVVTSRLAEIKSQIGSIREPAPWPSLVKKCYGDQLERIFGEGIRTREQAEALKQAGKGGAIRDIPPDPAANT